MLAGVLGWYIACFKGKDENVTMQDLQDKWAKMGYTVHSLFAIFWIYKSWLTRKLLEYAFGEL